MVDPDTGAMEYGPGMCGVFDSGAEVSIAILAGIVVYPLLL